jgi:hypothetical protein
MSVKLAPGIHNLHSLPVQDRIPDLRHTPPPPRPPSPAVYPLTYPSAQVWTATVKSERAFRSLLFCRPVASFPSFRRSRAYWGLRRSIKLKIASTICSSRSSNPRRVSSVKFVGPGRFGAGGGAAWRTSLPRAELIQNCLLGTRAPAPIAHDPAVPSWLDRAQRGAAGRLGEKAIAAGDAWTLFSGRRGAAPTYFEVACIPLVRRIRLAT